MGRRALGVALVLLLAACGGDDGGGGGTSGASGDGGGSPGKPSSGTASSGGSSVTTGPVTDGAVNQPPSTTVDIVTSPTVPTRFGQTGESSVGSTTTTSEVPWDGLTMPLTGEPAPEGWPERPALVVKVGNNDWRSLPQVGLESADVVYELMVENFVTRFVAVFHSDLPEAVRPVRSARSSDIDLIGNLDRPMFAYWGANEGVAAQVRGAERYGVLVERSTMGKGQDHFSRDEDRKAPYNGVLDPTGLLATADDESVPPGPLFTYGSPPPSAVPTAGVRWTTANRDVAFVWEPESDRWLRHQDGVPHLDADGRQLAADNVLKLTVGYRKSDADFTSPQLLSTGSGDGWLFRDGTVTGIIWSRQFVADGWSILDDDTGERLALAPGTTWVLMTRLGEGEILDAREAAALVG